VAARPSKSKPSQANPNKIAWFYSSESGLINGLQRFQIEFLLPLPFALGRLLIFARWESKDYGDP
jgi:hypothetical protein